MSGRIRHSALPKLAQCPKFEGAPGTSPEAARGSEMDAAFRAALAGVPGTPLASQEDADAVAWAVAKARELAAGEEIEAREEFLRMETPGIEHMGTADALCRAGEWVADLKTGQMRGYYEQMAAYALACMDRWFLPSWTAHVLYCDAMQVASYRFDWSEAHRVVSTIVEAAKDPAAQPRGCEYCGWCKHKDRCPARVDAVNHALEVIDPQALTLPQVRERILAAPDRTANFMRAWKVAEKEVADPVFDEARKRLDEGAELPGWKLSAVEPKEFFDHIAIVRAAAESRCGLDSLVLAMGGTMGGKKFREWAASLGVAVDESLARKGAPSTQLRQAPAKKKKS